MDHSQGCQLASGAIMMNIDKRETILKEHILVLLDTWVNSNPESTLHHYLFTFMSMGINTIKEYTSSNLNTNVLDLFRNVFSIYKLVIEYDYKYNTVLVDMSIKDASKKLKEFLDDTQQNDLTE